MFTHFMGQVDKRQPQIVSPHGIAIFVVAGDEYVRQPRGSRNEIGAAAWNQRHPPDGRVWIPHETSFIKAEELGQRPRKIL